MAARRERNKDKTRATILNAAKLLFSQKGFKGTSIHDIEIASKVSKGLILHHFGTKELLYTAVRESLTQAYIASLSAFKPTKANLNRITESAVRASFMHTKENDDFRRVALWSYLEGMDESDEMEKLFTEALVATVKTGQAAGKLRSDINPLIMPFIIKGAIDFWIRKRSLIEYLVEKDRGPKLLNDNDFIAALSALMTK